MIAQIIKIAMLKKDWRWGGRWSRRPGLNCETRTLGRRPERLIAERADVGKQFDTWLKYFKAAHQTLWTLKVDCREGQTNNWWCLMPVCCIAQLYFVDCFNQVPHRVHKRVLEKASEKSPFWLFADLFYHWNVWPNRQWILPRGCSRWAWSWCVYFENFLLSKAPFINLLWGI